MKLVFNRLTSDFLKPYSSYSESGVISIYRYSILPIEVELRDHVKGNIHDISAISGSASYTVNAALVSLEDPQNPALLGEGILSTGASSWSGVLEADLVAITALFEGVTASSLDGVLEIQVSNGTNVLKFQVPVIIKPDGIQGSYQPYNFKFEGIIPDTDGPLALPIPSGYDAEVTGMWYYSEEATLPTGKTTGTWAWGFSSTSDASSGLLEINDGLSVNPNLRQGIATVTQASSEDDAGSAYRWVYIDPSFIASDSSAPMTFVVTALLVPNV